MSIPPVPSHPPRPGRRKPAEESPDSITTQLFIGQDKSPTADGSTQALSSEELARLRSMVASDGVDATEVLSLDELRQLAAAENDEPVDPGVKPRKVQSADIAEAEAASAPKQWNPLGNSAPQTPPQAQSPRPAQTSPHAQSPSPEPWNSGFGAPGQAGAVGRGYPEHHSPQGSAYAAQPGPAYANNAPGGPYAPAAGGPGVPNGPGHGPSGPAGPGGHYRREPETKKVPAWLWVLASIALVAALGIVGYIAWDATQSPDEVASGPATEEPTDDAGSQPATDGPESSAPPVATETFTSPSGNISCTIDSERTRCVISSFDYKAPDKPDDCQLENWGAVVVANNEGAGFSCREAPETSGPARVLGYGESITAEGMTCTSTEEGMTCKSDDTGVGFTMRRASVDFLD